jgi:hypothetical protein
MIFFRSLMLIISSAGPSSERARLSLDPGPIPGHEEIRQLGQ